MRRIFSLLLLLLTGTTAVLAQSNKPNSNESVVAVFEKVLKKFKAEWSKSNYNSMIFVPDVEIQKAIVFQQMKATSFDSVSLYLTKPEKSRKFLYTFPVPVDSVFSNGETEYKFPTGGYSLIEEINLAKSLTFKGDTIIYKTDSAKSVKYPGLYGIALINKDSKTSFQARLSYAWYLPEGYEYISYKSNRKGYWQRQGSLIHFIGDYDENNFLFDIRFRKKHAQPTVFQGRKVDYTKTISVKGDHIDLFVNDAQTEDGDIISLNLNGEWIVRGLEVSKAGAKIRIPLIHKENYLIMHAENLGSIPPNTASMRLSDGAAVHQITLNSDAGKSEAILFVRP
jgi:hypothetical protein